MSFFDKLKFWKKDNLGLSSQDKLERELGLPPLDHGFSQETFQGPTSHLGNDFGSGNQASSFGLSGSGEFGSRDKGYTREPLGRPAPMQQPFSAPVQPSQPSERDSYSKDLDLVSAKLDSIRYTLESINQRLANLERLANWEREQNKKGW